MLPYHPHFNNEFNHDIFQAQTNYTELNMSDWKNNNSSSLAHGRFKKVSKVFVMRVIELASIYLTFYDLYVTILIYLVPTNGSKSLFCLSYGGYFFSVMSKGSGPSWVGNLIGGWANIG